MVNVTKRYKCSNTTTQYWLKQLAYQLAVFQKQTSKLTIWNKEIIGLL